MKPLKSPHKLLQNEKPAMTLSFFQFTINKHTQTISHKHTDSHTQTASQRYTHTHRHTHTHTHTHRHTHTHTRTHTHTQTHTVPTVCPYASFLRKASLWK